LQVLHKQKLPKKDSSSFLFFFRGYYYDLYISI